MENLKLFNTFLKITLQPFDSAACITQDGELLDLKFETLADIGSLGASALTVIKYFKLKIGDVVLLNDPYSGGTTLSMLTFVTPLLNNHSQLPDLYLAVRFGFRPQLVNSKTLDEEGLRIPPTPLVLNRVLNNNIVDAITSHPLCPKDLKLRMDFILSLIWKRIDTFQIMLKKSDSFCSRNAIKNYLLDSKNYFQNQISEVPHAEGRSEVKLDSGELIKLRLELTPQNIIFDFAGTSSSKRIGLTDSATFGACFGSLTAFFQKTIPTNSGTFSLINVISPLGSMLNAKYPTPTYRGMTEGISLVAGCVIKSLSNISTNKNFSMSSLTNSQISLEFENGSKFFDSLPGGIGATTHSDGADAVSIWTRNRLKNSVHEIEKLFPLIINSIQIRKNSGGKGSFKGGNGLKKEYTLKQNATFYWILPSYKFIDKPDKSFTFGVPGDIQIIKSNGKTETINTHEGSIKLNTNDKIVVSSSGGGGIIIK